MEDDILEPVADEPDDDYDETKTILDDIDE
jgi:hypothetical protein